MLQSEPGRAVQFAQWQEQFDRHVEAEIERRGIIPTEPYSDPRISPSQLARIEAAAWNPTEPGEECQRRTGPVPVDLPPDQAVHVEMEVHAREIAWRFGDGPEPLTMEAARKLAAVIQCERRGNAYDEHDALQVWWEHEGWKVLHLFPSERRSAELQRALSIVDDPATVLRERGIAREDLPLATCRRWRQSCLASQALRAELFNRPHLDLDDQRLARLVNLALRQFGEHRVPTHLLVMTPREQLAFLMEMREVKRVPVPPLVVRPPWGPPTVDVAAVTEVLRAAFSEDPSPPEQPRPAERSWQRQLDRGERLRPEKVLPMLEMSEAIPGLDQRDCTMLTIQSLERASERWVLAPAGSSAEIAPRKFSRASLLAVDGVVRAIGTEPRAWFSTMLRYCREFACWTEEMVTIMRRIVRREPVSDEDLRRAYWFNHVRNTIGPRRDYEQFRHAIRDGMQQLGQDPSPEDIRALLADYRERTRGKHSGLFASADGRLLLGARQFRDRSSKAWGLPRLRAPEAPPTTGDDALDHPSTESWGEAQDVADARDALEAVAAADTVGRLRKIVARRLAEEKPGSIRRLVLENFEELARGELTVRALAKRERRGRTAINRALEALKIEVAAELTEFREE